MDITDKEIRQLTLEEFDSRVQSFEQPRTPEQMSKIFKQRRLICNRMSAAKSRQRHLQYVKQQSELIADLEQKVLSLQQQNEELREEVDWLTILMRQGDSLFEFKSGGGD